jgi:glycine cleavage system regulatory protein
MQIPLVLTVIGADRPGLVEKVAGLVAQHGGNWLESRMCRLGGQFAGIVRVSAPAAGRSDLARALAALGTAGLRVEVFADDASAAPVAGPEARLELVGQDRPGIVRQIAATLAARGVNVEELATECVSAPMSGEPLFQAKLRLRLPPACGLAELRLELERIAADLQVDVTVEPLPSAKA